jgi:integrase
MAFLNFLDEEGTDLQGAAQADMDTWLCTGPSSAAEVADFIDWAMGRKLCGRLVVASRRSNEGLAMDDDARFEVVRRLLRDDSLEVADRVAGCLVLLYGQQISRIVTLRRDQLQERGGALQLHLGPTSIEVPEPLASLLESLARSRRPKVGVVPVTPSPWLFPGLDPGQPLNAAYLGERLRRLGVATMPGRRRALVHLAGQLPAAVVADLVGIHATTAVAWSRAAGADWTTYAAELVRDRDRGARLTPAGTTAD